MLRTRHDLRSSHKLFALTVVDVLRRISKPNRPSNAKPTCRSDHTGISAFPTRHLQPAGELQRLDRKGQWTEGVE